MVSVKAKTGTATGGTGILNMTGMTVTETSAGAAGSIDVRAVAGGTVIYSLQVASDGTERLNFTHPVDANVTAAANGGTDNNQANQWHVTVTGAVRWTIEGQ